MVLLSNEQYKINATSCMIFYINSIQEGVTHEIIKYFRKG